MSTLRATVASPCSGVADMNSILPNVWVGSSADFVNATVTLNAAQTGFVLVIVDIRSGSACSPSRTFDQDVPNAADPSGQYGSGSASVISI